MEANELRKIKEYQREYENLFGKKLHIDWLAMKNIKAEQIIIEEKPPIEVLFNESVERYKASADKIKATRNLKGSRHERERLAVKDFSRNIFFYKINKQEAAEFINKDRTMIYYYAFKM